MELERSTSAAWVGGSAHLLEAAVAMQINPTMLSDARILAADVIFFASYFVFALGKFPGFKIDPRIIELSAC